MVNAYLIVTDYHRYFDMSTNSRKHYRKEIEHVDNHLFEIAQKYKDKGYNIIFLFLGDIYHRQYNNSTDAVIDNNFCIYLRDTFGKCYSVLGNHEITYNKNNPFYTLFSTINSKKICELGDKTIKPKGIISVIDVVDQITDGDVVFHFNHYGCSDNLPIPGKINIGLYHKEYVSREIITDMEHTYNTDNWITEYKALDRDSVFRGYQYCFLGHLHKVYGKYMIKYDDSPDTVLVQYLASLGRPNHTQVMDNFLERNIPVVLVENGHFLGIEDNFFNLLPRAECIDERIVELHQQSYKRMKEKQKSINYVPISDDPIKNLLNACSNNKLAFSVLNELIEKPIDSVGFSLQTKCNNLRSKGNYGFKRN